MAYPKISDPMISPAIQTLKQWSACTGNLSNGAHSMSISCEISCSTTGSLSIEIQDVPLDNATAWLLTAWVRPDSPLVAYFALEATSSAGERLATDRFYFSSVGTHTANDHTVLTLRGQLQTLTWMVGASDESSEQADIAVKYTTVGLKGFGSASGQIDEGGLVLHASMSPSDPVALAGELQIQSPSYAGPLSDLVRRCDARTRDLLRVVSLSQGRLVRWSIREIFVGNDLHEAYFTGAHDTGTPIEPALASLDMDSVLGLAIANCANGRAAEAGVFVAIDWLMIFSTYAEVRFLNAASAIEHLLAQSTSSGNTLFPNDLFRDTVRLAIETALSQADLQSQLESQVGSTQAKQHLAAIGSKLGDLNRAPLRNRLEALLAHYNVPLSDIPFTVAELLQTRNRIVHGGSSTDLAPGDSITLRAGMLREVLRRTILAMLEFDGQFYSYLRGPNWQQFRPRADGAT